MAKDSLPSQNSLMKKSIMLAALALMGCSDRNAPPETAPATRDAVPPSAAMSTDSGCVQFTRSGLKLSARSRAALQAEAGRPMTSHVTVEPNRHVPGQYDSIFQLQFGEGLKVQIRKPGPGSEMVEYVEVTKRKWLNFPYFQPGVGADKVIAAMGEPQRREGDNLVYTCGGGEVENPVVFRIEDGNVEAIVFNYYVD